MTLTAPEGALRADQHAQRASSYHHKTKMFVFLWDLTFELNLISLTFSSPPLPLVALLFALRTESSRLQNQLKSDLRCLSQRKELRGQTSNTKENETTCICHKHAVQSHTGTYSAWLYATQWNMLTLKEKSYKAGHMQFLHSGYLYCFRCD